MQKSQDLTEREKACLYYAVFAGIDDFRTIWQISRDAAAADRDPRKNTSQVYSWHKSAKVQNYLEKVKREKSRMLEEARDQARKEIEIELISENNPESPGEKPETKSIVNFQDRGQFLQFLNKQANMISDPKLKADYLKMLSDLLRFKETETGKDNEIQRFYTPLTCNICPLYLKEKEQKQENDTLFE